MPMLRWDAMLRSEPRSRDGLARPLLGELEHVVDLPRRVLDAEARAERHLPQRHADLRRLGHGLQRGLGAVDDPPQLGNALLGWVHALVAGDGVVDAVSVGELHKGGMVAIDGEAEDIDQEVPGGRDVGDVLEGEAEVDCGAAHTTTLHLVGDSIVSVIRPLRRVWSFPKYIANPPDSDERGLGQL